MKKVFTFLFAALFCSQLTIAQTTLTTAVDFTATDIDGNSFNLFNTLNSGSYVFIDFMFTNCGPCQQCAPKMWSAFNTYGCNGPNAEVHFISINRDDNNAVMHSWESTYMNATGGYPQAFSGAQGSATGGTQTFASTYGVGAFPTMILIAPDHSILEQDIWPISTAADFTPFFHSHGLEPKACIGTSINNNIVQDAFVFISPVPALNELTINCGNNKISSIRIFDNLGKIIIEKSGVNDATQESINISDIASGIYFAEIKMKGVQTVNKKFIKL
ncbi:MAG: T9SS C-terminal target domain-containing protein [Sphingobacteriales bacterium]|nr:MAG: T9SS C-terminal target domain-containing protein [Sphingobacteriales bacterium]